jgi:uncharacterized surface protein with fasciclin (FAS1) repeats
LAFKSNSYFYFRSKFKCFVNTVGSDVVVNGGSSNGGAKVTAADIEASNGIVHVIDAVLKLDNC